MSRPAARISPMIVPETSPFGHLDGGLDHRQGEALDAETVAGDVAPFRLEQPRLQLLWRGPYAPRSSAKRASVSLKKRSLCQSVSSASKPMVVRGGHDVSVLQRDCGGGIESLVRTDYVRTANRNAARHLRPRLMRVDVARAASR